MPGIYSWEEASRLIWDSLERISFMMAFSYETTSYGSRIALRMARASTVSLFRISVLCSWICVSWEYRASLM